MEDKPKDVKKPANPFMPTSLRINRNNSASKLKPKAVAPGFVVPEAISKDAPAQSQPASTSAAPQEATCSDEPPTKLQKTEHSAGAVEPVGTSVDEDGIDLPFFDGVENALPQTCVGSWRSEPDTTCTSVDEYEVRSQAPHLFLVPVLHPAHSYLHCNRKCTSVAKVSGAQFTKHAIGNRDK